MHPEFFVELRRQGRPALIIHLSDYVDLTAADLRDTVCYLYLRTQLGEKRYLRTWCDIQAEPREVPS